MTEGNERTERDGRSEDQATRSGFSWSRIPGWKRLLLVLAVVMMVAGAALQGVAYFGGGDETPKSATPPAGGAPSIVAGFAAAGEEGETVAVAEEPAGGLGAWSPSIFRLGFSFFAGFAMAYALRSVLKLAIIAVGLLLLALVGLQYAGLVDVNWSRMSEHYDGIVAWIGDEFSTIKSFLTGYLPSAASGMTGLVVGFRRH